MKAGLRRSDRTAYRDVALQIVDPAERARIALMFLGLLDAAERAAGGQPRVSGRHALGDELLLEQRQVRIHLAREIVLGAAMTERRDEAEQKLPDGRPSFTPRATTGSTFVARRAGR